MRVLKQVLALATGILICAGPSAAQAQVAGDDCASAGEVTANGSFNFDTTGASGNDPCLAGPPTVFYRFTATTNDDVTIDLCGSTFDTYLTILPLAACPVPCSNIVAENNNTCGAQSSVTFTPTPGSSYLIVVSGLGNLDFGAGVLNFSYAGFDLPSAGNTCTEAGVLVSTGAYPFDNTGASGDDPCAAGPPTVWYRFTAPEDGILDASLCDSTFDTYLSIYAAPDCASLDCGDLYAENNDTCGTNSALLIPVTGGTTYFLSINGFNLTDVGAGVLDFRFTPGAPTVLAGDDCETAGVIPGTGLYPFDTTGASANDPCAPNIPTEFFRFTAPAAGTVQASLCGAGFDGYLTVIESSSCFIGCSNIVAEGGSGCGDNPLLSFPVEEGVSYVFVVSGGGANDFGPGVLQIEFTLPGDTCEDAIPITMSGSYPFDTTLASPNDPCAEVPTLWYSVTPIESGTVLVDLCGSSFDTYLSVFNGPACDPDCNADSVVQNNDSCDLQSAVSFEAVAGETYFIVVSGNTAGDFGPGVLNITLPGIVVVLIGDVNLDDVVNVADVTALSNWLRSDRETPIGFADVNFDGSVDELDVEALAKIIVDGFMLE